MNRNVCYANSLGAESMVLMDLICEAAPQIKMFSIDTGRLYAETYDLIERVQVSPLLDWSEQQIWDYIRKKRLPYKSLHDIGFPSIGCAPCTRAVQPGDDARSGRWWWERAASRECGLHPRRRAAI